MIDSNKKVIVGVNKFEDKDEDMQSFQTIDPVEVKEQIKRDPRPLPKLTFPEINSLEDLKSLNLDNFILDGYDPHPAIKAKMAI